jgi:competence protein ComEA
MNSFRKLVIPSLILALASLCFAQSGGQAKPAAASATSSKLVDINSASAAELKAIDGIGDVYSAKIIAGRPYANKAQLVSRNILPAAVYKKVSGQLVAKQKK